MRQETTVSISKKGHLTPKVETLANSFPDSGMMELCGYGKRSVSFRVSSASDRAILNIRDSYVYEHHNQPSLCFRFHDPNSPAHTARIHACENLEQWAGQNVRLYLSRVLVRVGTVKRFLPIWFCDSDIDQEYIDLTSECLRKLTQ